MAEEPRAMTRDDEIAYLVASGFTQAGAAEHLAERDAIVERVRLERAGLLDDSIDV